MAVPTASLRPAPPVRIPVFFPASERRRRCCRPHARRSCAASPSECRCGPGQAPASMSRRTPGPGSAHAGRVAAAACRRPLTRTRAAAATAEDRGPRRGSADASTFFLREGHRSSKATPSKKLGNQDLLLRPPPLRILLTPPAQEVGVVVPARAWLRAGAPSQQGGRAHRRCRGQKLLERGLSLGSHPRASAAG